MNPQPYSQLSDLALLELCIWREARGEGFDGKRGVAHVICNRSKVAKWWNGRVPNSISRVVLQPYQFSSFNPGDPNADKWPAENDADFPECATAATLVWLSHDPDNTAGATYYHDTSIGWPQSWGSQLFYDNTLNVGRLKFYRLRQQPADLSMQGDV